MPLDQLSPTKTDNPPAELGTEFKVLQLTNLIFIPLPALTVLFLNPSMPWELAGAVSLVLGLIAYFAKTLKADTRDFLISFSLIGHCALLTAVFAGHAFQIDTHMLYFAMLAIISSLYNPKSLIFATVLIAAHHASMSIFLPKLVYPSVNLIENLERTAVHAAIVVMEFIVLFTAQLQRIKADKLLAQRQAEAEAQAQAAAMAEDQAQEAQETAERIVKISGDHLARMASGELNCKIDESFPGAYAKIKNDFNLLADALIDRVGSAKNTSIEFRDQAQEVAGSVQSLSERTESQAATLTETTSALQELSSSVNKSAEDAGSASSAANQAQDDARKSGKVMASAVEAMSSIEASSSEISTIINVIEDISFQTNLLALNAGVEAARAGESGRGFAVVAAEVRALAQRTADAANEVKDLIGKSATQVRSGSDLVNNAGEALDQIVARVSETSELIQAISGTSREQASALREMADALGLLDNATQTNAAMVEEMTAMSAQMDDQARALNENLSYFREHTSADQFDENNAENRLAS